MADEDATTFSAQADPKDDPITRDRRAHTWKERERMAWWCMFALVLSMFLPYGFPVNEIGGRIVENGQWALGIVVLSFIGGKATVEAYTAARGIKP